MFGDVFVNLNHISQFCVTFSTFKITAKAMPNIDLSPMFQAHKNSQECGKEMP